MPGSCWWIVCAHPQKPSEPGDPLLQYVKESLTQVEHQIWLLRNIFWWYLLPPSLSIMAFFAHVSWLASSAWWEFLCAVLVLGLVLYVVYATIYRLNQHAVRSSSSRDAWSCWRCLRVSEMKRPAKASTRREVPAQRCFDQHHARTWSSDYVAAARVPHVRTRSWRRGCQEVRRAGCRNRYCLEEVPGR